MATDYNETIVYWDNVLGQIESFNPLEEIKVPQIEDAVNWICKDSQSILDFGFGTGKVIFRCLAKGVKRICGIDISSSAVRLAESVAIKNGFRERAKFIQGSIGALKQIESSAYDSIILFNILDNLKPDDALELLTETKRILRYRKVFVCRI